MLSPKELKRYEHHIGLPGFGAEKQEMLKAASVLIVGAGGLGCPVLLYLAAAGVGKIGIIDDDTVSVSNLQRQVLYSTKDIGKKKIVAAKEKLQDLNPHVEVKTWCARLNNHNALDIISEFDIVADCSDNIPTRYMVNDACVIAGKTLISGSVFRFEGQVLSLNCPSGNGRRSANYRDVFPQSATTMSELDCATAGVLSVVPGIVGCLQANEIIKHLMAGEVAVDPWFISVNTKDLDVKRLNLPDPIAGNQKGPATAHEFSEWKYESNMCEKTDELNPAEFARALQSDQRPLLIDVRMPNEFPEAEGLKAANIPLPVLEHSFDSLTAASKILVFCKSGVRSGKALKILRSKFPEKEIYSLRGGVEAWNTYCEKAGTIKCER